MSFRDGSVYQRGTVVLDPRQTRRLAQQEQRLAARGGADAVLSVAGVPLTRVDETQHFKFIGITGSGKTTAIGNLLAPALARGDRAIIADPDGIYTRRFYDAARGDIILNPFDERSAGWEIFREIDTEYDVEDLARSLIPDLADSHDNEWREYSRTFFTDVMQRVSERAITHREPANAQELHRVLTRAPADELRALLPDTASQTFLDADASKMFASIRAVTSSAVRAFKYTAADKARSISVRDWVREGRAGEGGVLFLPYRAGQIEALRSTISAWMRLGIFEAMNREEGDQRLWFVVDELGALGRIGGLSDGLTRLRKFGGRVVLGFQSIDQVQALYGKSDANTVVENCGNTLLLRCGTADQGGTSTFAAKLIGEREILRTTMSTSLTQSGDVSVTRSANRGYFTEQAVMAAEVEQLPNHTGFLRVSSRPEWMRVTVERPPELQEEKPIVSQSSPKRSQVNSIEWVEPTVEKAQDEPRVASIPEEILKGRFSPGSRPNVYYHHGTQNEAFRDEGRRLVTEGENARVINAFVQIAEARNWKSITVDGTDTFRREMWLQAAKQGLEVEGYKPTAADRAELEKALQPVAVKPQRRVVPAARKPENSISPAKAPRKKKDAANDRGTEL